MDAFGQTDAHAEEPVDDPDKEDSEAGQALALLQGEAGDRGGEEQQACNRPGSGPPLDGLRCLDPSHPGGCRWCVAAPLPSLGLFLARSHPANAFSLWAPLLPHRPPGASPPLPGGKNTCTDWWATRARKTARLLRQGEAGQCTACLRQCSLSHTPFVRPGEKKLRHLILSCPEWQLHGEREALVRLGGAFWGVGGQFWSLPVVRAGGTRGTCDSSPTHGDMCLVQGNRRGAHALGGRPSGQGPRPASLQR